MPRAASSAPQAQGVGPEARRKGSRPREAQGKKPGLEAQGKKLRGSGPRIRTEEAPRLAGA